jgi:hypothetical protein
MVTPGYLGIAISQAIETAVGKQRDRVRLKVLISPFYLPRTILNPLMCNYGNIGNCLLHGKTLQLPAFQPIYRLAQHLLCSLFKSRKDGPPFLITQCRIILPLNRIHWENFLTDRTGGDPVHR